jgi:hypothetical protein
MSQEQRVSAPSKPRSNRGTTIALIGLVEIALVALIVVVLLGQRVAAVADVVERIPGGRLAVAGVALVLLLVAALAMTVLVGD